MTTRTTRSAVALLAVVAAAVNVAPSSSMSAATIDTCDKVQTCMIAGSSTVCDVTSSKCPPCIFPSADRFNCFEYENSSTTQCQFASQASNYVDCSSTANWAKWSTTTASTSGSNITIIGSGSSANSTASGGTNSTTTPTPSSSVSVSSTASSGSSSNVIMFAGIGVGVLVLLIVIIAICKRRKNQARRRNTNPHGGRHSKRDRAKTRTKHEEAFGGGGGYNNVLDTSKNGGYGSYQRKISEPAMMEDGGRDSDRSYVSDVPTEEALSVDGMLGDPPQTPVVLGGGPSRMTTGKSMGNKSAFTSVNDLVNQDISIRCTTSANVFDEYLRMKQEMNYDHDDDAMSEVMSEMSDYESDTMSMHKFSLESSQGLVRHDGGLSITDSEYDEHLRNRGASECYSEMSYNDEKYSFSEDDDMSSELGRSKVGADREVEI